MPKEQEPISLVENRGSVAAERPDLTWLDSILPVVLLVVAATIVHFAFSVFVFAPMVRIFSVGSPYPVPIIPVDSREVAIVAVIAAVVLAVKARDRLMEWNYWLPPAFVALWSLALFLSVAAREAKREKVAQQYRSEVSELKINMRDPSFLMNLKPPLSQAREQAVMGALGEGERVRGTPLTSAEVHAILGNLGSDPVIQNGIAASPATSVDDLQWLAGNGGKFVRFSVAQNPHASHETLLLLMDDPDYEVSYSTGSVVALKRCDAEVIRIFWYREISRNLPKSDSSFRAMSANPCTPEDILRKLGTFPNPVGSSAAATLQSLSTR